MKISKATKPAPYFGAIDPITYVESIIDWHFGNERRFIWRNTDDAFTILVAEVMLQRTQASQVARVIGEFLRVCPTPKAVVSQESEVLDRLLHGLGMTRRNRRLTDICNVLIERHGGEIPGDFESLSALPGVGPYTANAVLCFAFGQDVAIVDENVVRVLTRVFGVKAASSRPRNDPRFWALASSLVPKSKSREYQFALLDFAAMVCTSRTNHLGCPFIDVCHHILQRQERPSDSSIGTVPHTNIEPSESNGEFR
jgi:A/G-specific adenine glycosylase